MGCILVVVVLVVATVVVVTVVVVVTLLDHLYTLLRYRYGCSCRGCYDCLFFVLPLSLSLSLSLSLPLVVSPSITLSLYVAFFSIALQKDCSFCFCGFALVSFSLFPQSLVSSFGLLLLLLLLPLSSMLVMHVRTS